MKFVLILAQSKLSFFYDLCERPPTPPRSHPPTWNEKTLGENRSENDTQHSSRILRERARS